MKRNIQQKLSLRLLQWRKTAKQRLKQKNKQDSEAATILMIFGCQRSGTTLMTRMLEQDWSTKVFPEHSELSNQDQQDGLRLNPLDDVDRIISRIRFPFVVMKPLVETQNATRLLDHFADSYGLWMYRHYADVANSNLQRFGIGNGIRNLRYIVQNDQLNWRAEHLPPDLMNLVLRNFHEDMNPYDAAALFWYLRNEWFFIQQLGQNPRVIMCRYKDLVLTPSEMLRRIYQSIGRPYPGDQIVREVKTSSIGRGAHLDISSEIRELCDSMLARLDDVYQSRQDQLYDPSLV